MMPVKIWARHDGTLTNHVETSRGGSFGGERYRSDAEALDQEIDRMLDKAVVLSTPVAVADPAQQAFVKRWAVGTPSIRTSRR